MLPRCAVPLHRLVISPPPHDRVEAQVYSWSLVLVILTITHGQVCIFIRRINSGLILNQCRINVEFVSKIVEIVSNWCVDAETLKTYETGCQAFDLEENL